VTSEKLCKRSRIFTALLTHAISRWCTRTGRIPQRSQWTTPSGGIKRGWSEIKTTYDKLFDSKGTYRFEFYNYTLLEAGVLFYVVGRERGELDVSAQAMKLAFRTSRIFQKDADARWGQVHHHGSIDNPQMLATYQKAVFGQGPAGRDPL
jgi:hypothetical protein